MKTMTLDKAKAIVAEVVSARKRWGKMGKPNILLDDLLDALVVVTESANLDAPSAEEVTKLRRQLAACQNREKARLNKQLQPGQVVAIMNDGTPEIKGTGFVEESTPETIANLEGT